MVRAADWFHGSAADDPDDLEKLGTIAGVERALDGAERWKFLSELV